MFRFLLFGFLLFALITPNIATAQSGKDTGNRSSTGEPSVAVVNGERISYKRYRQALADHIRSRNDEVDSVNQMTDDAVFLELVDEELTFQEAAKLGIVITREDALKMFIADPPPYVREVFVDEKGNFNRATFEQVVRNPKLITNLIDPGVSVQDVIDQWKTDVEKVVRYYQYDTTRKLLMDSLYSQDPLSETDIKHRFFAENTLIDGSFIRVMHTTIPEEEVSVSDAEAKEWYDVHKEEYRIPPSRTIRSFIIPVLPSPADSIVWHSKIDSIQKLIKSTPWEKRSSVVESIINNGLPESRIPEGRVVSLKELPRDIAQDLATSNQGDLVGPYPVEDESLFFYVEGAVPSNDTLIHVRHILLTVPKDQGPEADASSRELANKLRNNMSTEKQFIEAAGIYSYDGSASEGGDIGYIKREDVVKEFGDAAFSAEVGEIVGPVKTQYGYHLIYIKDRVNKGFYLRELRFTLKPSEEIREKTVLAAKELTQAMQSGNLTDSLVQAYKGMYPGLVTDTSLVTRLEPYGDALIPGEFAFSAQEGDAGTFILPFDRVASVQLIRIWSHGLPGFEEIEVYPRSHALRKKQMDKLEPLANKIADSITLDMLLGPLRELAEVSHIFLLRNQTITDPPGEEKYLLDSLATVTNPGEVTGPVRGTHGYYYLRMLDKNGPTEEEYRQNRTAYTAEFMGRYRESLYEEHIKKARSYAEIQDLRPSVQSALSATLQ